MLFTIHLQTVSRTRAINGRRDLSSTVQSLLKRLEDSYAVLREIVDERKKEDNATLPTQLFDLFFKPAPSHNIDIAKVEKYRQKIKETRSHLLTLFSSMVDLRDQDHLASPSVHESSAYTSKRSKQFQDDLVTQRAKMIAQLRFIFCD